MKDVIKYLKANGKEYPLVFNINIYQEIVKKFGKKNGINIFLDKLEPTEKVIGEDGKEIEIKGDPDMDVVLWIFKECINEGIDMENDPESEHYIKRETPRPFLTSEKQVGRILTAIEDFQAELSSLVVESTENGKEKN